LNNSLVENKVVHGRSSLKAGYVKLQVKRFSVHEDEAMTVGKSVVNKSGVAQQQQQQQQQQNVLPQRRKSEPAKQKSFNSTNAADDNIKHYRQILCSNTKKC